MIVKARKVGRPRTSEKECERREKVVSRMLGKGKSSKQIAARLELGKTAVCGIADKLARAGETKALRKGPPPDKFWLNLQDKRTKKISRMRKAYKTYKEIGKAFRHTRAWAKEIARRIEVAHGPLVFEPEPDKKMYTPREAQKLLKASDTMILKICKTDRIPLKPRGENGYLLSKSAMEALRNHPKIVAKTKREEQRNALLELKL